MITLSRSIFQPKMHQISFGDPLWELAALPPYPLAALKGAYTSKGMGWGRRGEKRRGGRGWEGKGKREVEAPLLWIPAS